jgi:hypothetical protein
MNRDASKCEDETGGEGCFGNWKKGFLKKKAG